MSALASPFAGLTPRAPDALLALIAQFGNDQRLDKIDLGVGVFRDKAGATPVLRAVKAAEGLIHKSQTTKRYLGAEGDARFTQLLAEVVLGDDHASSGRLSGVQTPGGTGALRLGAELIARGNPGSTVWLGTPTWPNHAPVFAAAGLNLRWHRFFDAASGKLDFAGMMVDLAQTRPGDVLLLHGCCHNPTGVAFSASQWEGIAALCEERELLPFIDLAYQGLGDGMEADAAPTRKMLERLPAALVAYSCDKNFGLYRERVGALWHWSPDGDTARLVQGNVLALGRSLWSMPPDHGAAVVRTILEDSALRHDWLLELSEMRARLTDLRVALGAAHPRLAPIADQRGMFALLPLAPKAVAILREKHAVYLAPDGRINIAGLSLDSMARLVAALTPYLEPGKVFHDARA